MKRTWVWVGTLAILALGLAVAGVTARAQDWQPLSVLAILAVLMLLSEWRSVHYDVGEGMGQIIVSSSLPTVLATVLLGPAPALAISVAELLIGVARTRNDPGRTLTLPATVVSNFAGSTVYLVSGGLLARWTSAALGLGPQDELAFALLFVAIYAYETFVNFLWVVAWTARARRDSFRDRLRRSIVGWSADVTAALIGACAVLAYSAVGVEALALVGAASLVYAQLTRNLVLARRQAESLALHAAARGKLVEQLLVAEQSERRRLAELLHDGAMQELLALQGRFSRSGYGDELARDCVDDVIEQLRATIFDLHPAVLDHVGLRAALLEVAGRQANLGGFEVTVEVDPEACGKRDSLLFVLGRELLTNAAKHAHASEVALRLTRSNGSIVMEVVDDGRGMAPGRPSEALGQGHVGLSSSVERIASLGGDLAIESEPGSGTRIRTVVPVD